MHPSGKAKVKWDLMVAVLILYSTLSVPFRIGFEETASLFWAVVDAIVDVTFTLDIIVSFRTAFVDEVILFFLFSTFLFCTFCVAEWTGGIQKSCPNAQTSGRRLFLAAAGLGSSQFVLTRAGGLKVVTTFESNIL